MTQDSGTGPAYQGPEARPPYPGDRPGQAAPRPPQTPYGAAPAYGPQFRPPKPFSTKAIVAMTCAGVSVFFWPLAPLTGLAGAIFGWLGMKESKEPAGTHRGYGLALAGLIVSVGMLVVGVALIGLFVWMFAWASDQGTRMEQRMEARAYEETARTDMNLLSKRLQMYCVDNNRSLAPGGPLVREYPEGGLLPDDFMTVDEPLQVKHLVQSHELLNAMGEYDLNIHADEKGYTLTNRKAGLRLKIDDARYINSSFQSIPKSK